MKRAIQAAAAPAPAGAYSQGVRAGELVFVSGQVGTGDTVAAQTEAAIRGLAAILEAGGASLRDVVKVTAHVADIERFAEFDGAYRRLMPEPLPARTTVQSELGGLLVELDAIAVIGA